MRCARGHYRAQHVWFTHDSQQAQDDKRDFSVAEDDFIYWQDILEAVQAGRTSNLKCPFCYEGDVTISKLDRVTHIECMRCHHFIEGRYSDSDYE